MKKIIGIFVCMLLIGSTISSVSATEFVGKSSIAAFNIGNTLYVGGSGPGNYSTIQGAVDDAFNGDTVFVYGESSPYNESVTVAKSITIHGFPKHYSQ